MKEFTEYKAEKDGMKGISGGPGLSGIRVDSVNESVKLFSEYLQQSEAGLPFLTESENAEVDTWVGIFEDEYNGDISLLDESFLTRLVGGTAGFLIGPTIGKVIAKALGVEKGILFDMFSSRLVSAALGAAIAKSFEKK